MSEPVAVLGVGQTTYKRRHPESSAADLIWAAAEEALADAGLGIDAVDVIIAGVAPDALAGENCVEKTAIFGTDPNWGRVAMAIGKCEEQTSIVPEKVVIAFQLRRMVAEARKPSA